MGGEKVKGKVWCLPQCHCTLCPICKLFYHGKLIYALVKTSQAE